MMSATNAEAALSRARSGNAASSATAAPARAATDTLRMNPLPRLEGWLIIALQSGSCQPFDGPRCGPQNTRRSAHLHRVAGHLSWRRKAADDGMRLSERGAWNNKREVQVTHHRSWPMLLTRI